MEMNVAYDTVQGKKMESEEDIYTVPDEKYHKEAKLTVFHHAGTEPAKRVKCQLCIVSLLTLFSLILAVLALILVSILLATNSSQNLEAQLHTIQARLNTSSQEFETQHTQQQQEIIKCKSNTRNLEDRFNNTAVTFDNELSGLEGNIARDLRELSMELNEVSRAVFPSLTCGGPGWRRVALINMTDSNQDCPQGLNLTDFTIRSCGRAHSERYNCSSVTFPVDTQYRQVCGRATAYRMGSHFGFHPYHEEGQTIDGAYVDGLSLTHGSPRTHIWTFASGYYSDPNYENNEVDRCPCEPGDTYDSPPFVGDDYFCDSVTTSHNLSLSAYPDNALWDGEDLLDSCYELNHPPSFRKAFPRSTSDDIELRLCLTGGEVEFGERPDLAIELLELYVY